MVMMTMITIAIWCKEGLFFRRWKSDLAINSPNLQLILHNAKSYDDDDDNVSDDYNDDDDKNMKNDRRNSGGTLRQKFNLNDILHSTFN